MRKFCTFLKILNWYFLAYKLFTIEISQLNAQWSNIQFLYVRCVLHFMLYTAAIPGNELVPGRGQFWHRKRTYKFIWFKDCREGDRFKKVDWELVNICIVFNRTFPLYWKLINNQEPKVKITCLQIILVILIIWHTCLRRLQLC